MNKKDYEYLETVRKALLELTDIDDIHHLKEEIVSISQSILFKTIDYASLSKMRALELAKKL